MSDRDHAAYSCPQIGQRNRFGKEDGCTGGEGEVLNLGLRRDQDEGHHRACAERVEQIDPGHVGHAVIADHEVSRICPESVTAKPPVGLGDDLRMGDQVLYSATEE